MSCSNHYTHYVISVGLRNLFLKKGTLRKKWHKLKTRVLNLLKRKS